MNESALIAWTSLYIAVGIMAILCALLASIVTACDWRSGNWKPSITTKFDKLLLLPKILFRWQLNYLKGAPAILLIALYYAWSIGFSVFWDF